MRTIALVGLAALAAGCGKGADTGDTAYEFEPEILESEPAGAPSDATAARMTCLGTERLPEVSGSSLELTGYIRTLADPEASEEPPVAEVTVYSPAGDELAVTYPDASEGKDGRVAVTVPVTDEGFTGTVGVTYEGYLDWTFTPSRAVTTATYNGWVWLFTAEDRDAAAAAAGLSASGSDGLLVGAVHDCDGFGVDSAVVLVDGMDGALYTSGFDLDAGATWTGSSGRFVVDGLSAGPAEVSAYARLESGGPLVLISRTTVELTAGGVSAVSLDPIPRE